MKKKLLSTFAFSALVLSSLQGYGQLKEINLPFNSSEVGEYPIDPRTNNFKFKSSAKSSAQTNVDTVWFEDFANGIPAGWTLSGANTNQCPWVYSTSGSWGFFNGNNGSAGSNPIESTSADNGFLKCDPDSANNSLFGQPSGTTYQYMNTYITTAPFSTLGYPQLRIEFEQFFRYNNTIDLQMGISTDGTNFTFFDVKGNTAPNETPINPLTYSRDISAIAGDQAQVWLRFGWEARVYYWMIDDIRIITPPSNDIRLDQVYFEGRDSAATRFYTSIPQRHANLANLDFAADISNIGSSTANNARLVANVVQNASVIWADSSNNVTIPAGAFDSVAISSSFTPSQGQGTYGIVFEAKSDSIDFSNADNIRTTTFNVSANEFRRDNNVVGTGNWYNESQWQMAVRYDLSARDTIIGVSAFFPNLNNGFGLKVGTPLSFYVYNSNLEVVGQNEFYPVQATDINAWMTVPVRTLSGENVVLDPGIYYAAFKIYNDSIAIASSPSLNTTVPREMVLVETNSSGTWGFTTTIMPFVRMVTQPANACQGVTLTLDVSTSEFDPSFQGAVTVNSVTGGTPPYSFAWSASNGGAIPGGQASNQNLTNLNSQGTYSVTVSDLFGCSTVQSYEVGGTVGIDKVMQNKFSIYPNPSTGVFNLDNKGKFEGNHRIVVQNIVGAKVFESQINFDNQINLLDLSHLDKGIYLVNIIDNQLNTIAINKVVLK